MDLFWRKLLRKFVMINDPVAEEKQCFPCLPSRHIGWYLRGAGGMGGWGTWIFLLVGNSFFCKPMPHFRILQERLHAEMYPFFLSSQHIYIIDNWHTKRHIVSLSFIQYSGNPYTFYIQNKMKEYSANWQLVHQRAKQYFHGQAIQLLYSNPKVLLVIKIQRTNGTPKGTPIVLFKIRAR